MVQLPECNDSGWRSPLSNAPLNTLLYVFPTGTLEVDEYGEVFIDIEAEYCYPALAEEWDEEHCLRVVRKAGTTYEVSIPRTETYARGPLTSYGEPQCQCCVHHTWIPVTSVISYGPTREEAEAARRKRREQIV